MLKDQGQRMERLAFLAKSKLEESGVDYFDRNEAYKCLNRCCGSTALKKAYDYSRKKG